MIKLTTEQLENYVNQYFDKMIAEDPNYIDNCTSSWIHDATDWLCMREELQYDNIESDSIKEFDKIARLKWSSLYNETYGYRDYSRIMSSKLYSQMIIELQRACCPAKKYLCSEQYTNHLTQEQRTEREEIFNSINSSLSQILNDLNKLSKILCSEDIEK